MQRLFSMFPTGAPGVALLIFRLVVAASFAYDGTNRLRLAASLWGFLGFAVAAFFLCFGFLTPYCSAVCCLVELCVLLFISGSDRFHLGISIAIAGILMILGPGEYSIDARIFGRRRLVVRPRR